MKRIFAIWLCGAISLMAVTAWAQNAGSAQVLEDVDKDGKVFSFRDGVIGDGRDWDLMLDLPHGLGSNNAALVKSFKAGGIIDMGAKPMSAVKQAPKEGYQPALKPDEILPGHTYCVKLANGKEFAKIHVQKFDQKPSSQSVLVFDWELATDAAGTFK